MTRLGTCRHCRRNVIDTEGSIVAGRAQHDDCDQAIARMDATRRSHGKPPLGRPTIRHTRRDGKPTLDSHVVVTTIDGTHLRIEAARSQHELDTINRNAARRPRTWNETVSSHGGGTDR